MVTVTVTIRVRVRDGAETNLFVFRIITPCAFLPCVLVFAKLVFVKLVFVQTLPFPLLICDLFQDIPPRFLTIGLGG